MTFSERAVEAAARALRERDMAGRITVPWDKIPKGQRKKWIERGQAALTAALTVDGLALQRWQPIESAPEDTDVLVSVGIISCEARLHDDGNWYVANNDPTDSWGGPIYPTHWQPLPAPPLTAASDGEVG